ncbi:hypothetical protein Vretimale_1853 [Volvox reticuliferus]|uniref:Uncharacterized protein n=1 Tax=Volvox reticuliferus TaxID=1737510 RepID=A0A8J4FTG0_9CHLO|nr:hypothetical protein Vretifemale_17312 [Volvox reticuliferus]GIL95943.1 hypothetical protein Vretimale_1853 [Volvox reticuliferus]
MSCDAPPVLLYVPTVAYGSSHFTGCKLSAMYAEANGASSLGLTTSGINFVPVIAAAAMDTYNIVGTLRHRSGVDVDSLKIDGKDDDNNSSSAVLPCMPSGVQTGACEAIPPSDSSNASASVLFTTFSGTAQSLPLSAFSANSLCRVAVRSVPSGSQHLQHGSPAHLPPQTLLQKPYTLHPHGLPFWAQPLVLQQLSASPLPSQPNTCDPVGIASCACRYFCNIAAAVPAGNASGVGVCLPKESLTAVAVVDAAPSIAAAVAAAPLRSSANSIAAADVGLVTAEAAESGGEEWATAAITLAQGAANAAANSTTVAATSAAAIMTAGITEMAESSADGDLLLGEGAEPPREPLASLLPAHTAHGEGSSSGGCMVSSSSEKAAVGQNATAAAGGAATAASAIAAAAAGMAVAGSWPLSKSAGLGEIKAEDGTGFDTPAVGQAMAGGVFAEVADPVSAFGYCFGGGRGGCPPLRRVCIRGYLDPGTADAAAVVDSGGRGGGGGAGAAAVAASCGIPVGSCSAGRTWRDARRGCDVVSRHQMPGRDVAARIHVSETGHEPPYFAARGVNTSPLIMRQNDGGGYEESDDSIMLEASPSGDDYRSDTGGDGNTSFRLTPSTVFPTCHGVPCRILTLSMTEAAAAGGTAGKANRNTTENTDWETRLDMGGDMAMQLSSLGSSRHQRQRHQRRACRRSSLTDGSLLGMPAGWEAAVAALGAAATLQHGSPRSRGAADECTDLRCRVGGGADPRVGVTAGSGGGGGARTAWFRLRLGFSGLMRGLTVCFRQ